MLPTQLASVDHGLPTQLASVDPVLSTYLSKHGDILYPILKKNIQQHQEDPDSPQRRWEREMQAGFLMKRISKQSIIDSYWEGLAPQEHRLVCQHQNALDQDRATAGYVAELREAAERREIAAARRAATGRVAPRTTAPRRAGQSVQGHKTPKGTHPGRNGARASQRDRRPTRHCDENPARSSPEAPSPRAQSGPVRPTGVKTLRLTFNRTALAAPPEQPSPTVMASSEDADSSISEQALPLAHPTPQSSLPPAPRIRDGGRDDGPTCKSPINKFGWRLFRYFRHLERSLPAHEILSQDIFAVGRAITNGQGIALNHPPLSAAEMQYLAGADIRYNSPVQITRYLVGKYQNATAMAIYCEHNLRLLARSQAAGERRKTYTLNWQPATIQLFYNADVNKFTKFFRWWEATNIFPRMYMDATQQAIAPAMIARVSAAVRREVYEAFMNWEDADEVSNGEGDRKLCVRQ